MSKQFMLFPTYYHSIGKTLKKANWLYDHRPEYHIPDGTPILPIYRIKANQVYIFGKSIISFQVSRLAKEVQKKADSKTYVEGCYIGIFQEFKTIYLSINYLGSSKLIKTTEEELIVGSLFPTVYDLPAVVPAQLNEWREISTHISKKIWDFYKDK